MRIEWDRLQTSREYLGRQCDELVVFEKDMIAWTAVNLEQCEMLSLEFISPRRSWNRLKEFAVCGILLVIHDFSRSGYVKSGLSCHILFQMLTGGE